MIEIKRILCPIDFSGFSDRALAAAMKMAVWYGARLQVLHVMPPSTTSDFSAEARALSARILQAAVERGRVPGADISTELVESAETAARIIDAAEAFDADLIVTGSHGRAGLERVLLGSVVETLLHQCTRPILTIPSHVDTTRVGGDATFSRIVCAIDFSEPSLAALSYALSMAEEADAQLTMLHVIEMPPELRHAPQPPDDDVARIRVQAESACLARLRALLPEHARDYCIVETAVLEGGVSRQLLRMASARQADLIVLGVHGRNAFDLAFFGSNSKDVIRQAHCPVLIVPASRRRASIKQAS